MRMVHQHVGQLLQLGNRIGSTRRVRRRVEHDPFGLGRNRLVQRRGAQLVAVLEPGAGENWSAAGQLDNIGIAHPVGRRDDHLVAMIDGGHEGIEQHLLATSADGDLGQLVVEPVIALELGDDRLFELGDAVNIGVFDLAAPDCGNRCFLYVRRRVEIRLAGGQADDVAALRLEGAGLGGDGDGLRRLDSVERIGKKAHEVDPRDDCLRRDRAGLDSSGVSRWQEKSAKLAVRRRQRVSIAVVGGGIAGAAAAIALARKGFEVAVFEQAAAAETAGAGIQIGPNAARALQAIGAYEAVVDLTTAPQALAIRNGETGALLSEIPFGRRFETRYGAPYRVGHRADLLDALLRTAASHRGINFRYDSRVIAQTAESTGRRWLTLADGTTHTVEAVIGADGIRSTVRAELLHDGPPAPSGHRLYRALVRRTAAPPGIRTDQVSLYLLPHAHA